MEGGGGGGGGGGRGGKYERKVDLEDDESKDIERKKEKKR